MKHRKIMSVLMSVVMCMSFVMAPVSVLADETEAPEQTTEATEALETKETEAAKETTKATEPSKETEASKETEPPKASETEPSQESAPETAGETEPSETSPEEPEETVPSATEAEGQEASRKSSDAVTSGYLSLYVTYVLDESTGILTIAGNGGTMSFQPDSPIKGISDKVKKVVIEDGVTFIGSNIFKDFKMLTSVTVADSVTGFDRAAFKNCTALKDVRLPASLIDIYPEVFAGCTSLTSITIPGSTERIMNAFEGSGLTTVTIKEGVTNIDNWFKGCTGITNVNLPKSVKSIKGTFDGSNIKNVNYAGTTDDWKKIDFGTGDNPFENAKITYKKSLHTITVKPVEHGKITLSQYEGYSGDKVMITATPDPGYYYYAYMDAPNSAYYFGNYFHMYDKDMVMEFVFKEITGHEKGYQFDSFPLKFEITNNSINGTGTLKCLGFVNYNSSTEEGYYQTFGRLSIPAIIRYDGVAYKVTAIDANAFKGNKYIQTLTLGSNVAAIGTNAFYGCIGLTKVTGGAGLKTIGANAFARCTKLTSFTITSKILSKIGTYAFTKDSKLKTLYIKNTTKLTKKGVKKSLKGSKVKTVKVKKSKVKKYKKYFTKKNCGRKVKVKK